jgi:hypothetical protein
LSCSRPFCTETGVAVSADMAVRCLLWDTRVDGRGGGGRIFSHRGAIDR